LNADARTAGVIGGRFARRVAFRDESRARAFAITESRRSWRITASESLFALDALSFFSFPSWTLSVVCANTIAATRAIIP
jgi:hypothetical protein